GGPVGGAAPVDAVTAERGEAGSDAFDPAFSKRNAAPRRGLDLGLALLLDMAIDHVLNEQDWPAGQHSTNDNGREISPSRQHVRPLPLGREELPMRVKCPLNTIGRAGSRDNCTAARRLMVKGA